MRAAAITAGPNTLIEGITHPPHKFFQDSPGYQQLSDAVDKKVEPLLVTEQIDIIVDDKVSGFSLATYFAWGGHRREVQLPRSRTSCGNSTPVHTREDSRRHKDTRGRGACGTVASKDHREPDPSLRERRLSTRRILVARVAHELHWSHGSRLIRGRGIACRPRAGDCDTHGTSHIFFGILPNVLERISVGRRPRRLFTH